MKLLFKYVFFYNTLFRFNSKQKSPAFQPDFPNPTIPYPKKDTDNP